MRSRRSLERFVSVARAPLSAVVSDGTRSLKRGQETEDHRGERGHEHGERHDATVNAHLERNRNRNRRVKRDKYLGEHKCQTETQRAADRREQRALDQQLPDELPARSAERETNRDLTLPACGASEHEIADICRGDQHDEADRHEKRERRGKHNAIAIRIHHDVRRPPRREGAPAIALRITHRESSTQRGERLRSALRSRAARQSRFNEHPALVPVRELIRAQLAHHHRRCPEVGADRAEQEAGELGRGDADDREGMPVERDRPFRRPTDPRQTDDATAGR